jgi:hypothetical protein
MRIQLIGIIALFSAGCGAGYGPSGLGSSTTSPAGAARDSRTEIASLEGQIAHQLDRLGLPPSELPPADEPRRAAPAEQPPVVTSTPPAASPVPDVAAGSEAAKAAAAGAASPPPSAPPPETSPRPEPASADAYVEEESSRPASRAKSPGRSRPSARCRDVAAAADAICSASDRICILAAEIGDSDAHQSCTRARSDCARARSLASSCS